MRPAKSLDVCSFCSTPGWCRPLGSRKQPCCEACRYERFYNYILLAPQHKVLLPWQSKGIRELFGTLDIDTGLRVYSETYWTEAKKNGKSFLCGGLPLAHLELEDVDTKLEAYGCAASKDQAGIVFRHTAAMVEGSQYLKDKYKVIESGKRIIARDGHGFYQVVSADGDLQDGIEPSMVIKDELHRWKTKKAQILNEVTSKGMISRQQPIEGRITTAGEIYDSPLAYAEHERARQVADGTVKVRGLHVMIFQADPKRFKDEPDYWKSREARVAANPSHEDLGGFLRDAAIVKELDKAITTPSKRHEYLRYHLNLWVESGEQHIPMDAWYACLPTRPVMKRRCFLGVDLSATSDLSSAVLTFPDDDGSIDVLPFFFVPKARLDRLEAETRMPFNYWAKEGYVIATPGDTVDYGYIREKILWAREEFDLLEIDYDRRFAHDFIEQGLRDKDGFDVEPVPQSANVMTAPMNGIVKLLLEGRVRHDQHPVLNWNADCLRAKQNLDGSMHPAKPDRMRDAKRIDGMSALLNTLARWMALENMEVMSPIQ